MGLFDVFKKKAVTSPNIKKQKNENAITPVIFQMRTPDDNIREFEYLGQGRDKTFRSDHGLYTEFYYLCREKESYYLLMFSPDRTSTCIELLDGDYEKLVQEDANFWYRIVCYEERKRIYGLTRCKVI